MPTVTPPDLFGPAPEGRGSGLADTAPDRRDSLAPEARAASAGPLTESGEVPQYPLQPVEGAPEPAIAKVPRAVALLTRDQKTALAILAKQAYDLAARNHVVDPTEMDFATWRHDLIKRETRGRADGLRTMAQRDFRAVRRELLNLVGEGGRAFADATGDQPERADWDLAWEKLESACARHGLGFPSYPAAIARNQFQCGLHRCTAKQLWALFYTCENRGRKKASQPQENLP